jgi:hypothetical protein
MELAMARSDSEGLDLPAVDPWDSPEEVTLDPVPAVESASTAGPAAPTKVPAEPDDPVPGWPDGPVLGGPDGRLAGVRRRLAGAPVTPLHLGAAGALAVVGLADGWRLALMVAGAAGAVLAMRLRFGPRAAAALTLAAAVLALAGWGPGVDRRPSPARHAHGHAHAGGHAHSHTHTHVHPHRAKAEG